jgi:hypothetical protein
LAAAGCGQVASLPSIPDGRTFERGTSEEAATELVSAAPDCVAATQALCGIIPRSTRGIGYFWIGYCGSATGLGDLRMGGSGDGFTFGAGFKVGETLRSFVEISYEKSLKHDAPQILTGESVRGMAFHERALIGGRTAAAPRARLEKQPRAYMSYGIGYNNFEVDFQGISPYFANGIGYYLGLGVEFPFAERTSLSFDSKYHMWNGEDSNEEEGRFSTATFSVMWIARF